jgi:RNA polymerase sigma factor (sigma-70 family)
MTGLRPHDTLRAVRERRGSRMAQERSLAGFLDRLAGLESGWEGVSFAEIQDLLVEDPARGWRIFVEKYSKFVWSLSLKFAHGYPDPEEFAAEIWGRVFERLRSEGFRRLRAFEGRCDFRTYLFRVVKTERFRLYRRRGVEAAARETLEAEESARGDLEAQGTRETWAVGLGRAAAEAALAELEREDREILALRFGAGLKLRELAEVLGARDTNDAAYRVRRALGKCRALAEARRSAEWDERAFAEACESFRAGLFQNNREGVSDPDETRGKP